MHIQEVRTEVDRPSSVGQRRAFLKLPLDERRRILAAQAERMVGYYEQEANSREREEWQGGDIIEPVQ